MKAHAVWFVVLGLAVVLLGQGCSTYHDRASGEEATYGCQTLKAKLDLDIGTVYTAAKRAAFCLRLRVMRAAEDGISGEIRAIDAQRDWVEIRLGALPEGRTRLTISVGAFGDKKKSIVMFEHIMANLSAMQQAAAAACVQWGPERRW
jgi:hypothetical protein